MNLFEICEIHKSLNFLNVLNKQMQITLQFSLLPRIITFLFILFVVLVAFVYAFLHYLERIFRPYPGEVKKLKWIIKGKLEKIITSPNQVQKKEITLM